MSIGCIICSDLFLSSSSSDDSSIALVNCGHTFHESCISDWLKKSPTCPICRNPASSGNILRLNLQSVSDLNTSQLIQNLKEETSANKKSVEDAKKKYDEYDQAMKHYLKQTNEHSEIIKNIRKDSEQKTKKFEEALGELRDQLQKSVNEKKQCVKEIKDLRKKLADAEKDSKKLEKSSIMRTPFADLTVSPPENRASNVTTRRTPKGFPAPQAKKLKKARD